MVISKRLKEPVVFMAKKTELFFNKNLKEPMIFMGKKKTQVISKTLKKGVVIWPVNLIVLKSLRTMAIYIYTIVGVLDILENRGYERGGTAPTTAGVVGSCF
jgi:hypothetical protein